MKILLHNTKSFCIFLILPLILFVLLHIKFDKPRSNIGDLSYHKVKFFDVQHFYEGAESASNIKSDGKRIIGGVIPHHLLPGFILSDFFKRLSYQDVKTVILIGPNHKEKGSCHILTSVYGWETVFGKLQPNKVTIDKLGDKICVNEDVLEDEHSVAGIMPYIKFYLPHASQVPLIISSRISEDEIGRIVKTLINVSSDESTVFVASVDFSHYLPAAKAREKDKEILKILKSSNYDKLYSLNNDYVDSPKSVGILFSIMKNLGKHDFSVLNNTNSGDILKDDLVPTTSYFEIAFYSD